MSKDWSPRITLPYIQVRHNSLILYSLPVDNYSHRRSAFTQPTYQGKVTSGSAKRIRKACDLLIQLSPLVWIKNPITGRQVSHTLSFITLTIPEQDQKYEANEGHKYLLEPFIRRMREKHGMTTYIWKAEFQQNGMLHYHITTRAWILHSDIKETWNNLLHKNHLLDYHYQKYGNHTPPSTQIKKVYKNKKLESYLQKEISKVQNDKTTDGKIWDCSLNLKQARSFTTIMESSFNGSVPGVETIHTPHCTILKKMNPTELLTRKQQAEYKQHLKEIPI